jgi:hypothetical protein
MTSSVGVSCWLENGDKKWPLMLSKKLSFDVIWLWKLVDEDAFFQLRRASLQLRAKVVAPSKVGRLGPPQRHHP